MCHRTLQTICSKWPTALITLVFCAIGLLMQNALVPIPHWVNATLDYDAIMQSYLLSWGSHSLLTSPASYYNPPIFFPDHNVIQSTDGLELPALLMTPLWIITKNPYLLANSLIVLSHIFAMFAAWYVARRQFLLNRFLAIVIAVLFAFTSDRLWHATGHLNLIWSGLLPLVWHFTWQLLEQPNRRSAIMLTALLGLSIYFSVYFFVMSTLCAAATVIAWLFTNKIWTTRRTSLILLSSIMGGIIIALPKIIIYAHAARGIDTVRNTLAEAALYSADWAGYLLPTQSDSALARVTGWSREHGTSGENGQFLGYTLCALIFCEIIRLSYRLLKRAMRKSDRLSLVSLLLGLAVILCSFGPDFHIFGISPYRLIYYPFLQFTVFFRVPARLAFVAQWLVLVSVCTFLSSLSLNKCRPASATAAALILPVVYFEHTPQTHPTLIEKSNTPSLAAIDQRDLIHVEPYVDIHPAMDLRMALKDIPNWRPTANGWIHAALDPAFDQRAQAFIEDFPSTTTIGWLATNGVPWVIVHDPEQQRRVESDRRFEQISSTQDASLFRLRNLEKAKTDYQKFCQHIADTLSAMRANTPANVTWPGTPLMQLIPNVATPFDPSEERLELQAGIPLPQTETSEFLEAPPTFWFRLQPEIPFPPGLYDQITVEYQLIGPPTKHRAHIYWGTEPTLKNTRRVKADVDAVKDNANHPVPGNHWTATFDLSHNNNWTTDPTASWLLIEIDRFKGPPPDSIKITNIHLSRYNS